MNLWCKIVYPARRGPMYLIFTFPFWFLTCMLIVVSKTSSALFLFSFTECLVKEGLVRIKKRTAFPNISPSFRKSSFSLSFTLEEENLILSLLFFFRHWQTVQKRIQNYPKFISWTNISWAELKHVRKGCWDITCCLMALSTWWPDDLKCDC